MKTLLVIAAFVLGHGGVRAQTDTEGDTCPVPVADGGGDSRAMYIAGERLYAAGHYDEAAVAFASALEKSGRAELLFDLANAYERMGERVRAADLLDRYVACARPTDAELVAERARRLRDTVAGPPLSRPLCSAEVDEPPRTGDILLDVEERVAAGAARARPGRRRAVPWLVAGGGALAVAAGLALAASATGQPTCSSDMEARPCRASGERDWKPALQGASAVSAVAGVVATTIGVVLVVRF